jgi:hypothetical protein
MTGFGGAPGAGFLPIDESIVDGTARFKIFAGFRRLLTLLRVLAQIYDSDRDHGRSYPCRLNRELDLTPSDRTRNRLGKNVLAR